MKMLFVMLLLFVSNALAALIPISEETGSSGNKSSSVEYSRDGVKEFVVTNQNFSNFDSKVSSKKMGDSGKIYHMTEKYLNYPRHKSYNENTSFYDAENEMKKKVSYRNINHIQQNNVNDEYGSMYDPVDSYKQGRNNIPDYYENYGEKKYVPYTTEDNRLTYKHIEDSEMYNNYDQKYDSYDTHQDVGENSEELYYDESNESYDSEEYKEMYIDENRDEDVGKEDPKNKNICDTNNNHEEDKDRDTTNNDSYNDIYDTAYDSNEEYGDDLNNYDDSYNYHEKESGKEMNKKDDFNNLYDNEETDEEYYENYTYDDAHEPHDEYGEVKNNNYDTNGDSYDSIYYEGRSENDDESSELYNDDDDYGYNDYQHNHMEIDGGNAESNRNKNNNKSTNNASDDNDFVCDLFV